MKYFKFIHRLFLTNLALFSVNFANFFIKQAKLSVFVLPFLISTAFAYPVNKISSGKTFYTGTNITFQFDRNDMPFLPVKLDFWGDYYTASSQRTFDIISGHLFYNGQQFSSTQDILRVQFQSARTRLPYFCFYKYTSPDPTEPMSSQRACYVYDSYSGSLPSDSHLNIVDFSAGSPDYTLTYREAPPTSVRAGENVTIKTRIKNIGSGPANASTTWKFFFKQGSRSYNTQYEFGDVTISPISAGGFKNYDLTFNIPVDTPAGQFYLYSDVDYYDYIDESNEANNRFFFTIDVQQPAGGCTDPSAENYDPLALVDDQSCFYESFDLSLSSVTINNSPVWARDVNPGGTPDYLPGDDFYLKFLMDNLGNSQTQSTHAALFLNPADAPFDERYYKNQIGVVEIPPIAGGETERILPFDYDVPPLDPGTYVLSWFIDRINVIRETNEVNNKDFIVFTVAGGNGSSVDIPGCTNPAANNYNTSATSDDGTCYFINDSGSDGNVDYNQNTAASDGILAGVGQNENTTAGQNILANLPQEWTDFDFSQTDLDSINDVELNLNELPDDTFFDDTSSNPVSCPAAPFLLDSSILKVATTYHVDSSDVFTAYPVFSDYTTYDRPQLILNGSVVETGDGQYPWDYNYPSSLDSRFPNTSANNRKSRFYFLLPANFDYTQDYQLKLTGTGNSSGCIYTKTIKLSKNKVGACTDPTATNFDQNAHFDDGSCRYPVVGCRDPEGSNYNASATEGNDQELCTYEPTFDVSAGFSIDDGYVIPKGKQFSVSYWFNEDDLGFNVDQVRFYKHYQQYGTYKDKDVIDGWNDVDQTGHKIYDEYNRTGEFVPRMCFVGFESNKSVCVFVDGKSEARLSQSVTVIEDDGILGCIHPQADNYDPQATVSITSPVDTDGDGTVDKWPCAFSGASLEFTTRKFESSYLQDQHQIQVNFRRERFEGQWIDSTSFPNLGAQPAIDYRSYVCYSSAENPDLNNNRVYETCAVLDNFDYDSSNGLLSLDLNEDMRAKAVSCNNQQVFRSFKIVHVTNSNDRIEMNFFNSWKDSQSDEVPSPYCEYSLNVPVNEGDGSDSISTGIFSLDFPSLDLPDDTPDLVKAILVGGTVFGVDIPGVDVLIRSVYWVADKAYTLIAPIPIIGDITSLVSPAPNEPVAQPGEFLGHSLALPFVLYDRVEYSRYGTEITDITKVFVYIWAFVFFMVHIVFDSFFPNLRNSLLGRKSAEPEIEVYGKPVGRSINKNRKFKLR